MTIIRSRFFCLLLSFSRYFRCRFLKRDFFHWHRLFRRFSRLCLLRLRGRFLLGHFFLRRFRLRHSFRGGRRLFSGCLICRHFRLRQSFADRIAFGFRCFRIHDGRSFLFGHCFSILGDYFNADVLRRDHRILRHCTHRHTGQYHEHRQNERGESLESRLHLQTSLFLYSHDNEPPAGSAIAAITGDQGQDVVLSRHLNTGINHGLFDGAIDEAHKALIA